MGNWAYLHRLEGGIGVGMGVGGQQLDPGHKVRAAAAVIVMMGRKKKVVSQYMCCAIKSSPRKKKEEEEKKLQIGSEGEEGEKNQKCVLQMLEYRTPPGPSSFNLFLSGGLVVFLLSWKEFRARRCSSWFTILTVCHLSGRVEGEKGEQAAL